MLGIHYLLQLPAFSYFSDLEILAILVAASVHDLEHPGVSNNFLIATRDSRALLYNDKSVLENHHCATAFKLVEKHGIADLFDRKTFSYFRSCVIEMVLATDLAQHFNLLTTFKTKVCH